MRVFIILLIAILGLAGCSKTSELPVSELHAIGIYEGHAYENAAYSKCLRQCERDRKCRSQCEKPAWPGKTSMVVPVDINRSGKSVTLILGSYDPIKWDITRHSNTKINEIILIGYGANEASVEVNGKIYNDVSRQRDIGAPNKSEGERFRNLVSEMPGRVGFERLDSFQGRYQAPKNGFSISEIQTDNSALNPDYLQDNIQAINPEIDLHLYGIVADQSGEFLANGTLVKPLTLTPNFNIAVSADGHKGYQYTRKGIIQIDVENQIANNIGLIPLPRKDFKLGHFKAIALDEKRNRLLVIFQAGAATSKVMAFDLNTKTWSEFGSTGRNEPNSLFYDAANDRFLVSLSNFSGTLSIGTLNAANGQYKTLRDINFRKFDGLTDLYDVGNRRAPYLYIAGLSGNHIVLATDGKDIFSRAKILESPFRRIYVLDLKTRDLKLTYYD